MLTLKLFDGSPTSNIVVGYSFDIKKMSGEFGVWPATFSKSAQNFVKKCQQIAPVVHFLRKNVVPCWCNKKNNSK